ncbi:CopG family transcriptional regulator [bacterium]|nr:CopG family transcriptional regulator [bacterium]
MPKTITLRVNDQIYNMFRTAAEGVHRPISNFIEVATISYITNEKVVSDFEMDEIMADESLVSKLKQGESEIQKGNYNIVE